MDWKICIPVGFFICFSQLLSGFGHLFIMLQCSSEINLDTLVSTIGDLKKCSNKFTCFVLFILGLSNLIQHKVCWRLGYCYSWYLSSYTGGWCRVCIVSNWWLMGLYKEVQYLCPFFPVFSFFGDIMKCLKPLLSSSNIGTNMPQILLRSAQMQSTLSETNSGNMEMFR